jgi:hypothetical protein
MIARVFSAADDAEHWKAALPADACVLGSLEFARATELRTGCAARLLVVELGQDRRIVYPFFVRSVEVLPFAKVLGEGCFDTFTPEYTGPLRIGCGPALPSEAALFSDALCSSFREMRVIAEFAHLSPWHAQLGLLEATGVEDNRDVVWLDLSQGEEEIWRKSYTSDMRRMVRQSQRAGVVVRQAHSREDVLAFHRLYAATMARRQAKESYCFPPEYLLSLFHSLPHNVRFFLAEHGGLAVAGGLLLYDDTDAYWCLSAANLEHARARPVNAYVHEMVRWAVRAGKRRLLCGGGHDGPLDGVFRFKASLSPLRAKFQVFKRIHDLDRYAALVRARWGSSVGVARGQFFPEYREGVEVPPLPLASAQPETAALKTAASGT